MDQDVEMCDYTYKMQTDDGNHFNELSNVFSGTMQVFNFEGFKNNPSLCRQFQKLPMPDDDDAEHDMHQRAK